MSRKGNIGQCALYPEDFQPGIISSDVLRIRPDNSRLSSLFLMCLLHNSSDVVHQIEMVGNGQIMKGINVTKLKSIEVYVPPLDIQKQFEAFIQQSDKSKFAALNASNLNLSLNLVFQTAIPWGLHSGQLATWLEMFIMEQVQKHQMMENTHMSG